MQYRTTWHPLHMILTICFLPWFFIWLYCHVTNEAHNDRVKIWEALQK